MRRREPCSSRIAPGPIDVCKPDGRTSGRKPEVRSRLKQARNAGSRRGNGDPADVVMGVMDSASGERVGGDMYRSDEVATDGALAIASGDTGTSRTPGRGLTPRVIGRANSDMALLVIRTVKRTGDGRPGHAGQVVQGSIHCLGSRDAWRRASDVVRAAPRPAPRRTGPTPCRGVRFLRCCGRGPA